MIKDDVMQLSKLELEHENHGKLAPVEELAEIELELEPDRKVTIERELDVAIMAELIICLSQNIDVFTWIVKDMPGINPKVTVHRLNVNQRQDLSSKGKDNFHLKVRSHKGRNR